MRSFCFISSMSSVVSQFLSGEARREERKGREVSIKDSQKRFEIKYYPIINTDIQ